jgi:hypothetical protein
MVGLELLKHFGELVGRRLSTNQAAPRPIDCTPIERSAFSQIASNHRFGSFVETVERGWRAILENLLEELV